MTTSDKWRLITGIAVALLVVIVAGIIYSSDAGPLKGSKLVIASVLANLASSLIVFVVGWSLLRNDSEGERKKFANETIIKPLKESFTERLGELQSAIRDLQGATTLEQIDWAGLIAGASEIDFVVQGWDRWFDIHDVSLREFLEGGGKFRLFVYDPISDKMNQARALMAERLGKTPHEIVSEIRGTTTALNGIRDDLPQNKRTPDNIEIVLMTQVNLYFAARFIGKPTSPSSKNRDAIVFSIYSHTKTRVNSMPAITIFPDMYPSMGTWFEAELAYLRRTST
jgi:hypothetical protein